MYDKEYCLGAIVLHTVRIFRDFTYKKDNKKKII